MVIGITVRSCHQGADGAAVDEDIGAVGRRALFRAAKHLTHDGAAVDGDVRRVGTAHVRPIVPCAGIGSPARNVHIALAAAKHVARAGVNQLLHMTLILFDNGPGT